MYTETITFHNNNNNNKMYQALNQNNIVTHRPIDPLYSLPIFGKTQRQKTQLFIEILNLNYLFIVEIDF